MPQQTSYKWVPFYEEFANKLLPYQNKRPELIKIIQNAYSETGIHFPTLEQNGEMPTDIDPFTVFGLFNKGMSDVHRTQIASSLGRQLGVTAEVPTLFGGIPTLNNLNATFYYFKPSRGEHDIDDLWKLLKIGLDYAADSNADQELQSDFVKAFNKAKNLPVVRWKITIALFWIRPNFYISLDGRNRWGLDEMEMLGSTCAELVRDMEHSSNGEKYLAICKECHKAIESPECQFNSLPEFSNYVWEESERVNAENKKKKAQAQENQDETPQLRGTHYWLYLPGKGAGEWNNFYENGLMGVGWKKVGDLNSFKTQKEISQKLTGVLNDGRKHPIDARTLWQFANDVEPGDVIFARKGRHNIVGRGTVTSDYRFEADQPGEYSHVRDVDWSDKGNWDFPVGQGLAFTLLDITNQPELIENLNALFPESLDADEDDGAPAEVPAYTREDFLSEAYMSEKSFDELCALLRHQKNVILQGAPGVGKTFIAKRLAFAMMGCRDEDRVQMVQFHQSYSYEDFVMGYRPTDNGFELRQGVFYNFCKKAETDPDDDYFFIIDEINRGNLSRIFGELFMLIEPDKRGKQVQLMYSGEFFSVPKNLYLIGTMNTADRSIAIIDYALRRRFAFFELEPGFQTEGFKKYQDSLSNPQFDKLVSCIESLNADIESDESLGSGFRIGHSYLCGLEKLKPEEIPQRLAEIVKYELVPLLREYWFDDPDKTDAWAGKLRQAIANA